MDNRNPTKHYTQETKEWATGTLQNTTQETKEWATGTLQNTIKRKLKNGQQEPYKTLHKGSCCPFFSFLCIVFYRVPVAHSLVSCVVLCMVSVVQSLVSCVVFCRVPVAHSLVSCV
jgi:hypothetical protein